MNILVVDDEKEIADVVELYLQNEYHVLKFYTGQEALECIEKTNVDLAILDVMLPGKSGFEVCREVRKSTPLCWLSITWQGRDRRWRRVPERKSNGWIRRQISRSACPLPAITVLW